MAKLSSILMFVALVVANAVPRYFSRLMAYGLNKCERWVKVLIWTLSTGLQT